MTSWVPGADGSGFGAENLPYGVFSQGGRWRCGVRIGDHVLDLAALEGGALPRVGFDAPALNAFMETGPPMWAEVRAALTALLGGGGDARAAEALIPLGAVRLRMPFEVAGFTDFYAGRHHAENVGTMMRGPEDALPPNWLHMPIGYNGRASTVVVSGTPVRRPMGQILEGDAPVFAPTRKLDFELELGTVLGTGSGMGEGMTVAEADAAIFGHVLLNDWSARDVQAWEYRPLGPFQAKAFATTISPWVVPAAALAPYRRALPEKEVPTLPHLAHEGPSVPGVDLAVDLTPPGGRAHRVCETSTAHLWWSPAQQAAHHASSGCAMRTGDLLGSGTISGPAAHERGALIELTWNGRDPLDLDGTPRTFLEDGDTVALSGATPDGLVSFGTCAGTVRPARGAVRD